MLGPYPIARIFRIRHPLDDVPFDLSTSPSFPSNRLVRRLRERTSHPERKYHTSTKLDMFAYPLSYERTRQKHVGRPVPVHVPEATHPSQTRRRRSTCFRSFLCIGNRRH